MKIRKGDVFLSTGKGYIANGKHSGEVCVVVDTLLLRRDRMGVRQSTSCGGEEKS